MEFPLVKLNGGFILAMKLKLLAVGVDTVEIETGLESKTSDLYLQSFMELGSSLRMKYVSLLINYIKEENERKKREQSKIKG